MRAQLLQVIFFKNRGGRAHLCQGGQVIFSAVAIALLASAAKSGNETTVLVDLAMEVGVGIDCVHGKGNRPTSSNGSERVV